MGEARIEITIVVNGQPVVEKAGMYEEVGEVVLRALKETGNSGQPLGNWELRDEAGQIINLGRKFGELGIKEGAKFFLNLKAGVGGAHG